MFATRIAQRIARTGTGSSVVFGLAGPWGSGKTSMLNLITKALSSAPSQPAWSVVHFTPWAASDTDTLIAEFYTAIASALPQRATTAREMLRAAVPVGAAVGGSLLKAAIGRWAPGGVDDAMNSGADVLAERLGKFEASEDPFQVRFNKISEAIRESGTRVLVVVDDLDRLHTDELLAVMKAVRLLGRFPNVHYLLAYDKTTVLDLLTSSDLARDNRDRAHRYLEKIVQYPFVLPPIQRVHTATELRDGLESVAHDLGLSIDAPATRYAVEHLFDVLPEPESMTLRSIKQLCLQTDVLCSLVGPEEVDLFDAAVITYIRLNYPDLYDHIPGWRRILVSRPPEESGESGTDWDNRLRLVLPRSTDRSAQIAVYKMLVALFPMLPHRSGATWTDRAGGQRISNPDYFGRYFQFALPEGDLSDTSVRESFRDLLDRGEFDSTSVIRDYLGEVPQRRILLSKVFASLPLVQSATSANSAAAATALTRRLAPQRGDLYSGWGTVIHALLDRSIATADTSETGRHIVNTYGDEFGLHLISELYAHYNGRTGDASDNISRAWHNIREQIVDACVWDIQTSETPIEDGILAYARVLDDDMWSRIRSRLRGSGLSQSNIAAHFVGVSPRFPGTTPLLGPFHSDLFARLVSEEELNLRDFDPPQVVNEADVSLEGRRAFAAREVTRGRPQY
ncbi:P-loop NTPase fold protein [Nocardia sp. NPDC050697]|uniref:KAP family P-loop NTPase fold protein n=1 Tax=Nocardia sp. NPDC050697 TaxID=3155158 RepID=UPI00340629F3